MARGGREIDFLGFVMTRDGVRVRKSIKQRFARSIARVRSRKRRAELAASYKGWCMRGRGRHLYDTIMGFKEKGIEVQPLTRDGQKYFDVRNVSINEIVNTPIAVLDYQPDIPTRDLNDRSKRNNDRYVVLIRTRNGEKVKFITNAYGIKSVLDQCGEREAKGERIFPVEGVSVQRRSLGGNKVTYKFVDL